MSTNKLVKIGNIESFRWKGRCVHEVYGRGYSVLIEKKKKFWNMKFDFHGNVNVYVTVF